MVCHCGGCDHGNGGWQPKSGVPLLLAKVQLLSLRKSLLRPLTAAVIITCWILTSSSNFCTLSDMHAVEPGHGLLVAVRRGVNRIDDGDLARLVEQTASSNTMYKDCRSKWVI